jgi:phosphate transport system substrate-binding protein
MKQLLFSAILVVAVFVCKAQSTKVRITGTRLVYPLFQKWVSEYGKTHAGIQFEINSSITADSADMVIASYAINATSLKQGKGVICINKYAQLPVANSHRKDIHSLLQSGFNEGSFHDVYFSDSSQNNKQKQEHGFTVYTREKPACATVAFASHFGNSVNSIHGVGVKGDDQDLLTAVKLDANGVSYNNLGFIYDVKTRKVVNDIAIIPIDLNGNGTVDDSEKIYNTLDEVVSFCEKTNHAKIPIENVNVIYSKQNKNEVVIEFLKWVLNYGQVFNHEFGFLNLSETTADDQLAILLAQQPVDLDALYGKQE